MYVNVTHKLSCYSREKLAAYYQQCTERHPLVIDNPSPRGGKVLPRYFRERRRFPHRAQSRCKQGSTPRCADKALFLVRKQLSTLRQMVEPESCDSMTMQVSVSNLLILRRTAM
jgi:hypothetical protein